MTEEAIIITFYWILAKRKTFYWNLYEAAETTFDAWKWNLGNIEFAQIVSGELKWRGLGVAD